MALKATLKSKGLFKASVRSTDDNGLSVLHHAISFQRSCNVCWKNSARTLMVRINRG